jgi:hypothetical protein
LTPAISRRITADVPACPASERECLFSSCPFP